MSATGSRVAELIEWARAETGLDDFGGDGWQEGLEVLVGSALGESQLTPHGEKAFFGSIQRTLANRLRVESWFVRYPEIADEEVHVELLGVGFPRTGSTALSHLLGEDGSVRSLRMWEASSPCPPPGFSPEDDAARIAAGEATVAAMDRLAPRMRSMLPQSATGPMEDHDLVSLEFKAQVFLTSARLPSYAEWYVDADMEPAYRYERRVLQLLQWRCPPNRWQLKSPTHTLFLDAFSKVFPEARFVMTHRDPSKVLASVTDLYCMLLAPGLVALDEKEVGELNLWQWGLALDRCLAFRDAGHDDRFYDIGFNAFQTDPVGEIRGLYAWLGRGFTPELEQRIREWWAANRRKGAVSHDVADFGFSEPVLAERFRAYRTRFPDRL